MIKAERVVHTPLRVNATPTVSVILTCYSGEAFFSQAAESIVRQTYPGLKLIFHDNGCTPAYRELIWRTSDAVGGAVYRSETNRYGEGLRYDVLPNLDSDFLAILHDDDVYEPEKVEDGIREISQSNLDYIFTDRRYIDEYGVLLRDEHPEINRSPPEIDDFPYQFIADTYYAGLRLHFSTMIMATDLARRTLLGDPFIPRIADSYFMHRLLLDKTLRGMVSAKALTRVRVHGTNDMLYTKFEPAERAKQIALLQFSEYGCFQDMVAKADDEQLAHIFARFPGVQLRLGEGRVSLLVRTALALRDYTGCKPLMAAWCIHRAFDIDPLLTMRLVRSHAGAEGVEMDANSLSQHLYKRYIDYTSDLLRPPPGS